MPAQLTSSELSDARKARATSLGTAVDAFAAALLAAQSASDDAKTAADADNGAAGGTVTAVDDADALIQALDVSAIAALCYY